MVLRDLKRVHGTDYAPGAHPVSSLLEFNLGASAVRVYDFICIAQNIAMKASFRSFHAAG